MCVSIHTHVRACLSSRVRVCLHTHTCMCVCPLEYECLYTHMYVHTHACTLELRLGGVRTQVCTVLGVTLPTVDSTLIVRARDAHGSLEPEPSLQNRWEGRSQGDRHQDDTDAGKAQGAVPERGWPGGQPAAWTSTGTSPRVHAHTHTHTATNFWVPEISAGEIRSELFS